MTSESQSVVILGTGSYAPEKVVTNDDMAQIVDTSDEWIRTRSGIRQRHFVAPGQATSDLACKAAERALDAAQIAREDIDLIIVATMTPDMPSPSTACLVQSKLGLPNITALDVQAACSGFIYAMNVATAMLKSGAATKALVIGAETMSSILDFEDRTTCVLFGDGAGAVVLGTTTEANVGVLGSICGADGSNPDLLHIPGGGSTLPTSESSLQNRQHFLKMNGKEIFKLAVRVMLSVSQEILSKHDYSTEDISLVIPHQANMRIIESLMKRLKLDESKFHNNLDRFGNTSAASIPIALDEASRQGRTQPGDLILLVAFGAGLTWGSTLIKWQ